MGNTTGRGPENIEGEKFVRWATSPDGDLFEIRGASGLAVTLPLARTIENGAWVSVIPSGGSESVYGLTCENLREARKHASEIAGQMEDGTLQMDTE